MIQIFVKSTVFDWTHAEKTITLEVEATMSVAIVKAMIQDLEMVPMDEQVLSFDGRTLEDNDSLADYNIQGQSTLLLRQSQVEGSPRNARRMVATPRQHRCQPTPQMARAMIGTRRCRVDYE